MPNFDTAETVKCNKWLRNLKTV